MKVLVNYFEKKFIIGSNTDLNYPKIFGLLDNGQAMSVSYNSSFLSFSHYFSFYTARAVAWKAGMDLYKYNWFYKQLKTVYIPGSLTQGIDLFFSHGQYPIGLKTNGIPVLTNTGFMTNEFSGVARDEDRLEEVKKLRRLSSLATLITFSTQDAINRYCCFEPDMRSRIRVAPFLIRPIVPVTDEEITRKHMNGKIKIAFIGSEGKRKGIVNLLKAITNIYREEADFFSNCEFHFVTRDDIKLPAGISYKHDSFLPNETVKQILRDAAIFAMPTTKESYGIVYIEAMGNGCAVLCDDEMPRREIFRNRLAVFTDPQSVTSIESGLRKLVLDQPYRMQLARDAYRHFSQTYSFEVVSNYYRELFRETIDCAKGNK